ncbi:MULTISPECIES: DNA-processing protein DprA [unclassified Treponema]|uniref:DNA-processing protein DprA n=1 Tax=unclassified Treponema TaxID=2638727 RepID=UPI0020A3109D|nr:MULTISPECIES: DNA-processing protein DprA [unclassified Treponema]UTC65882.1 DNA-protecting protein DprA [Treponema sp. OMZ 789]UTC68610.1 DNA-protecting protein DprA [Treponema sp. OMZ 790]UTC71340.1 DNA-protecting protein DprA [Treponema sp. OMZ 791]
MNISEKEILHIGLSHCYFLKGKEKLLLSEKLDSLSSLLLLSIKDISVIVGRQVNPRKWDKDLLKSLVDSTLKLMDAYNIEMLYFYDSEFPPQLREIPDHPFTVFYRGSLPSAEQPMLAMVGTRRPTGEGIEQALNLGKEAGEKNIPVVSGLAFGIDAFSHRGCLEGRGKTIAVLACGPEMIYPRSNKKLAANILESGGCILSEYAPGTEPLSYRFPERNRIISGLSRSVLIVEAPKKSGALITSDFALEQGRDVYVCEPILHSLQNEGGKALYAQGAFAIKSIDDILHDWKYPTESHLKNNQQNMLFTNL